LLLKLGAAKKEAGNAYGLMKIHKPKKDQPVTPQTFQFSLDRKKLRAAAEARGAGYLLRSNIKGDDPGHLWRLLFATGGNRASVQGTEERSFGSAHLSPVGYPRRSSHLPWPSSPTALMVTLKQRLKALASGLTPRAALEKLAAIQMIDDVELPTTDGRTIVLSRHTEPENHHLLLLRCLKLDTPCAVAAEKSSPHPESKPPDLSPPVVPTFRLAPQRF